MKSIPPVIQKALMILMPPIALLACCFVVVPRQNRLRQVNRNIGKAQLELADYKLKLEAISSLPADPTIATLPMSNQEQSNFVRSLANLCVQTGNVLLSVDSFAPPAGPIVLPTGTPQAAQAAAAALPPEILPVKSTIRFEGTFSSLREFLKGLQRSRRLILVTECKIGAADQIGFPRLQNQVTITRYLDTPPDMMPKAPPAPKKT